jgi:CYTH domain-containing protein
MLNDKEYGKYALVERERRFLLRDLPEGLTRASEHVQIWDNYIKGTRLRLRQIRVPLTKERRWKLTQKYAPAPPDFSRAVITNIHLSPQEYETFSVFTGNEIRKNRYPFQHEGRKYGVDMFLGPLWGLVLAETSFETDEEMDQLSVPPFAVAEVSRDEMFTGGKLAYLTIEDLQAHLSKHAPDDATSFQSPSQHSSQS